MAQNKLDSLQNILKKAKEDSNKVNILQQICGIYRFSEGEKGKQIAQQSLELAQKIKYPKGEGFAYLELGILADLKGEYKQALSLYEKAEAIFLKHNILKGQANVLQNRGMLYYYQSDYLKAQKNYLEALRIMEKIKHQEGQAAVLNNLGALYENKKDYKNALKYYQEALDIKIKLNKPAALASTYNNIGNTYFSLRDIEKAEIYFQKSLDNAEKYKNERAMSIALTNLGYVLLEKNLFEKALDLYQKSLAIDQKIQNEEGIGVAQINIGHTLLKLGKQAAAIMHLENGLKIMERIDYKYHIQNALQYLAEAHAQNKDFEKSYQYQKRYTAIHDSIYTEDSNRKIAEMQMLYETEKKDKQIAIQNLTIQNQTNTQYFLIILASLLIVLAAVLWNLYRFKVKTNRILDEKNRELIRLNALKDKLFAIVAHDLKNPLSAFRSITQSLSENILNISKQEIDYFIKQLNDSAGHLFDLLQNLLSWAIAQIGKLPFQPENIALRDIVAENINLLQANADAKGIKLINDISTAIYVFADKQMLRAVVRNLVSNAIKFTEENGEVKLVAQELGSYVEISVEDNGIGIAESDLRKLFNVEADISKIGDSSEKGTGLGLLLCKELVEKNGGQIGVESVLGKGSRFYFSLATPQAMAQ